MGMGLGFSAGAGGAGEALTELLAQKFAEQIQKQKLAQEAQRIQIAQQSADDNSAYRRMQQESQAEDRHARQAALQQKGSEDYAEATPMGSKLDPSGLAKLAAGGFNGPQFVQHKDATLGSTNLSGVAQTTKTAPQVLRLASAANPGQDASDTFLGTSKQKSAEQGREDKITQAATAAQDKKDAAAAAATQRDHDIRLSASLRPAPQAPLVMVQTVDEQGNPVTKMVKKEAGATYAKPANATTSNRVSSAEAVTKTGDDIIAKLSDPKYAAVVGPAMGRASSLQELIGNPPPEFAELAGEIESYALANMGVHGMRSSQGADQIKHLLEGKHTPESLIATIRGLNHFSNTFVQGNKPKSGGPAAPDAASKAADLIKKYGGG